MARWVPALVALLLVSVAARKSAPKTDHEPRIEEVTAKQLERLLTDKDFVAVFWCKLAACQPHPAPRVLSRRSPLDPRRSPVASLIFWRASYATETIKPDPTASSPKMAAGLSTARPPRSRSAYARPGDTSVCRMFL
ncbi:unnamed protein product [Pieris macdunnoughi]|uniref:Uncharacterized protein n=1 Tax=Pieris macdunnoughi TaxID=345717 RepID=A0A821MCG4_9NEOP|nr:unnamed protein product [Pieris macdunnoughi]